MNGELVFWAIGAGAASLFGFFGAFRHLHRARIIEDTPTAKVRSAPQGYVELIGQAHIMKGDTIVAPLTRTDCCWWRYKIEKRRDNKWQKVEGGESDTLFLLRDDTGECIVDPDGADITPSDRSIWYGLNKYPKDHLPTRYRVDDPLLKGLLKLSASIGMGEYRYTEERILPGDEIYAIGLFKSMDDMDHHQNRGEIARQLLRDWKQDHAALLARFDRDKNGRIDDREWELARRTAHHQADRLYRKQMAGQILHTLSATGSRRRPYLLSALPQFELVRRYRRHSILYLLLFFGAGGLAVTLATTAARATLP
jgi:hypothetical protein